MEQKQLLKITKNEEGYYEINMEDLKKLRWNWPGTPIGTDFAVMDGKKVLSKEMIAKLKKMNLEALLINWPKKTTDSYVRVSHRVTLVFVKVGTPILVKPWEPWEDFCTKKTQDWRPDLKFDDEKKYKLIEIHEFFGRKYFRCMDGQGVFWPMEKDYEVMSTKWIHFGYLKGSVYWFLRKKVD